MCKDFSLVLVTNHHVAFTLHVLVFKYKELKSPEDHKVVQAFIIYPHQYNCVGKTGASQILVYFVPALCTHNTVTQCKFLLYFTQRSTVSFELFVILS